VTCLVERTAWEQADFRNDIYVPLCYDAEGSKSFLKVIMDVATLRIQGMSPVALKAEIERRYRNRIYRVPEKAGVSYMIAPIVRTWMMPDWHVHTMPMPHLMFYAPNITNEDVGADPASSLLYRSCLKRVSLSKVTSSNSSERRRRLRSWPTKRIFSLLSAPIAPLFSFHRTGPVLDTFAGAGTVGRVAASSDERGEDAARFSSVDRVDHESASAPGPAGSRSPRRAPAGTSRRPRRPRPCPWPR
jgi:hypothetical protein